MSKPENKTKIFTYKVYMKKKGTPHKTGKKVIKVTALSLGKAKAEALILYPDHTVTGAWLQP